MFIGPLLKLRVYEVLDDLLAGMDMALSLVKCAIDRHLTVVGLDRGRVVRRYV
jgi:hypothetical protein